MIFNACPLFGLPSGPPLASNTFVLDKPSALDECVLVFNQFSKAYCLYFFSPFFFILKNQKKKKVLINLNN